MTQGRVKTKLGLVLLPRKEPIWFSRFKIDQEVQTSSLRRNHRRRQRF